MNSNSKIDHLPVEILYEILNYVRNKKDLTLTCKMLNEAVKRFEMPDFQLKLSSRDLVRINLLRCITIRLLITLIAVS